MNNSTSTDIPQAPENCWTVDFCAHMWMGQSQGQHLYYALECEPPNNPRPLYADIQATPPTCAGEHVPPLCQTVTFCESVVDGRTLKREQLADSVPGNAGLPDFHDPKTQYFVPGPGCRVLDHLDCRCEIGGHTFAFRMFLVSAEVPNLPKFISALGFEIREVDLPTYPLDLGELPDSCKEGQYAFAAMCHCVRCRVHTHRVVPG